MDKNGPDADFPYNGEDINHPGQYAVVSVNWSDDNIRILRSIYGTVPLALQSTFQSNMGVERDATTNGPDSIGRVGFLQYWSRVACWHRPTNSAKSGGLGWLSQASTIRSTLPDGSSGTTCAAK